MDGMERALTPVDRLLDGVQNALETVLGGARAERPNPAGDRADVVLDDAERRHAAGLMRIIHVGVVCAQAV
jgi:ubiquinone biosynthesis monooxygenase Coq7